MMSENELVAELNQLSINSQSSSNSDSSVQSSTFKKGQTGSFTKIYVSSIPLNWTLEDLVDFFSEFGTIVSSKLNVNEDQYSHAIGYLVFSSHIEAIAAIQGAKSKMLTVDGVVTKLKVNRFLSKKDQERQQGIIKNMARLNRIQGTFGYNIEILSIPDNVPVNDIHVYLSQFGTLNSLKVLNSDGYGSDIDDIEENLAIASYAHPSGALHLLNLSREKQLILPNTNNTPLRARIFKMNNHDSKCNHLLKITANKNSST